MKKPILKLVTEFKEVKWVQDILYPWEEPYLGCLGFVIPIEFESYLAIRHDNDDESHGPLGNMNHEKLTLILRDYTTCLKNCFVAIWNGFGWNFQDEYSELFEELIDFAKIAGKCGIHVRRMWDLSSPSWVIPHLPGKRVIKSEPPSHCRNFELSLVHSSRQPMCN